MKREWFMAWWERVVRLSRRTPKELRLCASLPLGERRFVAVVEFERARFLLGGTPSSLVLLSRLEDAGERREHEWERGLDRELDRGLDGESRAGTALPPSRKKERGEGGGEGGAEGEGEGEKC